MNHVLSFLFIVHCSSFETDLVAVAVTPLHPPLKLRGEQRGIIDFHPSCLPAGRQGCRTRHERLLNPQWVKLFPLSVSVGKPW